MRAKVTLDDTALSLLLMQLTTPTTNEWAAIEREVRRAYSTWRTNGWLTQPEDYHLPPPRLSYPRTSRMSYRDLDFMRMQFTSKYQPRLGEPGRRRWQSYTANRTAYAWVLRHRGQPRPWLVCIHGYGMGTPMADFEAFPTRWLHRELGLNLAFPVLPLHGPRKIGWFAGERFLAGNWLDTIHGVAQAIWDVRRLLSWIRQRGTTIGLYGLSLGGYVAALVSALDSQLACVIAGVPAVDLVRLARRHIPLEVAVAEEAGVSWAAIRRVCSVVSPLSLATRVPRPGRYIFGASQDRFIPPDQVRALWEHWDRPRSLWYEGSHCSLRWEERVESFLAEALQRSLHSPIAVATRERLAA